MMKTDWNIRTRAKNCTLCQAPFMPEDKGISLLFHSSEMLIREDLCLTCAKTQDQQRRTPLSTWLFSVEPPQIVTVEDPLSKETAESLFKRLVQRNDPTQNDIIYVLAIMLERGKRIVERATTLSPENTKMRIYEHRLSGETFIITDPKLSMDLLGDVQQRIIELFESSHSPLLSTH